MAYARLDTKCMGLIDSFFQSVTNPGEEKENDRQPWQQCLTRYRFYFSASAFTFQETNYSMQNEYAGRALIRLCQKIRQVTERKTMNAAAGQATHSFREMRKRDPFMDRRTGEDRRKVYSLDYFQKGNSDRRANGERRKYKERRADCIRVSEWSSVCPNYEEQEYWEGRILIVDLLPKHDSFVS